MARAFRTSYAYLHTVSLMVGIISLVQDCALISPAHLSAAYNEGQFYSIIDWHKFWQCRHMHAEQHICSVPKSTLDFDYEIILWAQQVILHHKLAMPLQVHCGGRLLPVYLKAVQSFDAGTDTQSDFVRIRWAIIPADKRKLEHVASDQLW